MIRACASLQDHPRVCGKNSNREEKEQAVAGSPPRVREKLYTNRKTISDPGITPACAGKTLKGPNEIKTFLSF